MDIFLGKLRVIILNYLSERKTLIEQFEDALYHDTSACNAGLPEMNLGAGGDPF